MHYIFYAVCQGEPGLPGLPGSASGQVGPSINPNENYPAGFLLGPPGPPGPRGPRGRMVGLDNNYTLC